MTTPKAPDTADLICAIEWAEEQLKWADEYGMSIMQSRFNTALAALRAYKAQDAAIQPVAWVSYNVVLKKEFIQRLPI